MKNLKLYEDFDFNDDDFDFEEEPYNDDTESMKFVNKIINEDDFIVFKVVSKDWEKCCDFLINHNMKWVCKRIPEYDDKNIQDRNFILLKISRCKNEIDYRLKFYNSLESYADNYDEGECLYFRWEGDKINKKVLFAYNEDGDIDDEW